MTAAERSECTVRITDIFVGQYNTDIYRGHFANTTTTRPHHTIMRPT